MLVGLSQCQLLNAHTNTGTDICTHEVQCTQTQTHTHTHTHTHTQTNTFTSLYPTIARIIMLTDEANWLVCTEKVKGINCLESTTRAFPGWPWTWQFSLSLVRTSWNRMWRQTRPGPPPNDAPRQKKINLSPHCTKFLSSDNEAYQILRSPSLRLTPWFPTLAPLLPQTRPQTTPTPGEAGLRSASVDEAGQVQRNSDSSQMSAL